MRSFLPASPLNSRILLLLAIATIAGTAQALELTVTTAADSSWGTCPPDCSLRSAIAVVNSTPGQHSIRLGAERYRILSNYPDDDLNLRGDLDISGQVILIGKGEELTALQAGNSGRVLDILSGAKVTVRNLTISDGWFFEDGVAVRNHGELELRNVRVTNNSLYLRQDLQQGRGAGVANYHRLSVNRSEFSGNWIYTDNGNRLTATLQGAALYNSGQLSVRDSLFRSNLTYEGGQSAGAAIYSSGAADIARSAFVGNRTDGTGAAIANAPGATAIVSNSTFANNNALKGGVIANKSLATLQLVHLSIAHNNAIGVDNQGDLQLRNSLIISNRKNCRSQGIGSTFRMRGLLLGSWTDTGCSADTWFDDGLADSHVLESLQMQAGLPIYPLRAGSPALDSASGSCSSHDQRSAGRPRDDDGDGVARCDLGAYER